MADAEVSPLARPDGGPDPTAYHRVFDPFYRGAFETGRQVRIVHARQLHDSRGEREGLTPYEVVRRHQVLVVPAVYVAADFALDWLSAYAEAGGHLVIGPRTGYADHEARARPRPTISSELPKLWALAVSQNVMPCSILRAQEALDGRRECRGGLRRWGGDCLFRQRLQLRFLPVTSRVPCCEGCEG